MRSELLVNQALHSAAAPQRGATTAGGTITPGTRSWVFPTNRYVGSAGCDKILRMLRTLQLLICDDDPTYHLAVKQILKGKCECRSAYNSDEALVILRKNSIDVILLDVQMRTADEGLLAISRIKEIDPEVSIVMGSGRTDFETVRQAMRLGAVDYVPKDSAPDELWHVVSRVSERRLLVTRNRQQNLEVGNQQKSHQLVGESPKTQALRRTIERIRQSPANVVITGETGTGKEVVARQLRKTLPDGSFAPFIAVDSATIQSSTAESQLFGHEKGAFTGAEKASKGIFEEADGGVVYFDEIANMPLEIQAKLLRVIQEKEFVRLGSARVIQSDFRVVCATNRDLETMVRAGQFKDDLFQRLNVLPIQLLPLRDRTEDIGLLVAHFLRKQPEPYCRLRFAPEALEVLMAYSWPGNIRELGNLIAYVATMTDGDEVQVSDLPPKLRDSARRRAPDATDFTAKDTQSSGSFYDRIAALEKEILEAEYRSQNGNISKIALSLGMDRSHLYTKLKEFGLHNSKR